MSRKAKMFQRLDQFEADYRRLAAIEFVRWVHGGWYGRWSLFLVDKLPFLYYLKYPDAAEKEKLDDLLYLEKEIKMMRMKLNQPLADSPVYKVQIIAARICDAHESGMGTELQIAKQLLKELGFEEPA